MFRPMMMMAATAAVAFAAPAAAQAPRPGVPLARAVSAAEQGLSARAFDAELDRERGVLVYEIDLVKDGRLLEARVDAQTGKLQRDARVSSRRPFGGDKLKAAQSAPRTLTDVIAGVEDATKGRVTDIGLERRGGRYYYEVELAGARDREIRVDMLTGAITPVIDD
jgi:uncharacterized membrane protein YkoI